MKANYKINSTISFEEAKKIMVNKNESLMSVIWGHSFHREDYNGQVGISVLKYQDLIKRDRRFFKEGDVVYQIVEIKENINQQILLIKKQVKFNIIDA